MNKPPIVTRIHEIHGQLPAREAVLGNRLDAITEDLYRIAEDLRLIANVDGGTDSYNQLHDLADKIAKDT